MAVRKNDFISVICDYIKLWVLIQALCGVKLKSALKDIPVQKSILMVASRVRESIFDVKYCII